MSAFEEGDFDAGEENRIYAVRRRSRSRRKRSRDERKRDDLGLRRRGTSRNRRKRSESQRRHMSSSPEKEKHCQNPKQMSIFSEPPAAVVKLFPYDFSTVPSTDWFCWLCGSPNLGGQVECRTCGSQHIRGRTSKFASTELLTDFISSRAAERSCGFSFGNDVADAMRIRVESALKLLPLECQPPHLYEIEVLKATSASAGVLDERSDDRDGYAIALRFVSAEKARAALLTMKCKLAIDLGRDGPMSLRIGFSTRKDIPKPQTQKVCPEPEKEEKIISWVPPQWTNLEELKAILVSLNAQWNALGVEQQRFYNENISKVATLVGAQGTQGDVAKSPTTSQSHLSAASVSTIADMKKRLEEKKQALEQKAKEADEKRKQEEEADKKVKPDESDATTARSNKNERDSRVIASTHALLARIAQKKAMLQPKQSEVVEESIEQKRQKLERREISETITLAHVLPLPPKFPSVIDDIKRVCADSRAFLLLERIPFDIAQRVLAGVASLEDPRGSL